MYRLINNLFPTSVGSNTFITIMLLALTTTCDSGALLTTQGTHICLILSFILRGSGVVVISPNMRRGMVPWTIRKVTDLPPNAKLCEMQQNTHGLVQAPFAELWVRIVHDVLRQCRTGLLLGCCFEGLLEKSFLSPTS